VPSTIDRAMVGGEVDHAANLGAVFVVDRRGVARFSGGLSRIHLAAGY